MHMSVVLRWAGSMIAGAGAVVLIVLSIMVGWFQLTVADEDAFMEATSSVARDQQFREELVDAAVQDIMEAPQLDRYFGAADDGAWYSGAASWLKDRAKGLVTRAVSTAVESDQFPQIWDETLLATHELNLSETAPNVLTLDVTPLYRLVDDKVRSLTTVDLHLAEERVLLPLEEVPPGQEEGPIARKLHRAQDWAQALPAFAVGAVVLTLLSAGLMPQRRLIPIALIAAASGVGGWAALNAGAAFLRDAVANLEGAGGVVARALMEALTANTGTWGQSALGVGVGLAVLLLIIDVLIHASRQDAPERH